MINKKDTLVDGFISLEGGMDSGTASELLDKNQMAFSVNTTSRGSYVRTRPAFDKIDLTFDTGVQTVFENGRWQGGSAYVSPYGQNYIIGTVDGKPTQISISNRTGTVSQNSGLADNNPNQPMAWCVQAGDYFVIQDGQAFPIIYNGATWRRATASEVPVGKAMAFGFGRLWVTNGREAVAGDIEGGGTTVVDFTEAALYGDTFTVPSSLGSIVGAIFMAQQDTSTGQGQLILGCENGMFTIDPRVSRASWASTPNMSNVAVAESGCVSHYGMAIANGDVLYPSWDGIRSYRDAVAEFSSSVGRVPLSNEMAKVLNYDTMNLKQFISSAFFDNRLLMTTNQVPDEYGAYHKGIIALDFSAQSNLRRRSSPDYDGIWTGLNPVQLIKARFDGYERCFIICKREGKNELWEATRNEPFDRSNCRIDSFIETRAFNFDKPVNKKRLERGDIWLKDVQGQVDVVVEYRADSSPTWMPWGAFTVCGADETCVINDCTVPANQRKLWFHKELGNPLDTCEPIHNEIARQGYKFQVKISWSGQSTIEKLLLFATEIMEDYNASCI